MKIREITEAASGTGSANIAGVVNPIQAHAKIPKDKNGIPKAPQKKNPDGTAKNALDVKDNVMGTPIKR